MATSGQTVAQEQAQSEDELVGQPVEVDRPESGTTTGIVTYQFVDGAGEYTQQRVVVATKSAGEIEEINTPASRVTIVEGTEADLITGVLAEEVDVDVE